MLPVPSVLFRLELRVPVWRGLALALLTIITTWSSVCAQVDLSADHYKGYGIRYPYITHVEQLTLSDQFQTRTDEVTNQLELFATPVEKHHDSVSYPINNPGIHYTAWSLSLHWPDIVYDLIVSDQFGTYELRIGYPVAVDHFLLNPALNNASPGTALPNENHYKCYRCAGTPIDIPVLLTDQFFTREAYVMWPAFFCVPVEKRLSNGTIYPVVDPRRYYTVYEITRGSTAFAAIISDQFVTEAQVNLNSDPVLMVPSKIETATASIPSTWGRVKAQFR